MKRIIAIVLCSLLLVEYGIGNVLDVQAAQDEEIVQQRLVEQTVKQMKKEFPNSEIMVSNGGIHVVLSLEESNKMMNNQGTASTYTTNVNSSTGGSYRNFSVPVFETYQPYSQVYMNSSVVTAAMLKMVQPKFYAWVIEQAWAGLSSAQIAALALTVWGISVPTAVISVLSSMLYWYCANWDYVALNVAQSRSSQGKAYVVHGYTNEGIYYAFYAAWSGSLCPTYLGYNATWYNNIFDFA